MAKQKYVKVQINLSIGNRKSQIVDPIEVEEDANTFDGELNTLVLDFLDAVKALPTSGENYSREDLIGALCECFDLKRLGILED